MSRFLLDANLSPKVARYLSRTLQLDVKSLHVAGLASLPDRDVASMAKRENRVIITLDSDFAEQYGRLPPGVGIIYLNLPGTLRFVSDINRILYAFFTEHAETVELERSLVILTGDTVSILHNPDSN
ncbi:MAG: DUF5615 family PIN-like protein [Thermomicrobiales bacterium]|nr:DUF5615 family PIN-like protein [Thermomicrobiales bacterium]